MSKSSKTLFSNPTPEIHHALALWAAKCAERTLHLFEKESPTDPRPRLAIEALRAWIRGEKTMVECRAAAFAAHAAARKATNPAAIAAARATGQAAAVAHMWNHAPHTAAYAAKAASLSVSKEESAKAMASETEWQRQQLDEDYRMLVFRRKSTNASDIKSPAFENENLQRPPNKQKPASSKRAFLNQ